MGGREKAAERRSRLRAGPCGGTRGGPGHRHGRAASALTARGCRGLGPTRPGSCAGRMLCDPHTPGLRRPGTCERGDSPLCPGIAGLQSGRHNPTRTADTGWPAPREWGAEQRGTQHHGPAGPLLTLPKLPLPMARRIWKWSKFTVDEAEGHQASWREGRVPPPAPTVATPGPPEAPARCWPQAELQLLCKEGGPEPRRGVGPGGCAAPLPGLFVGKARPPSCRQNGTEGAPSFLGSQGPSGAPSPGQQIPMNSWSRTTNTHEQEALGLLGPLEPRRQGLGLLLSLLGGHWP